METLLQDLRYGARMLIRRPAFTVVAVLSLALGIGANTAIFAVVDGFLWRPFPVEDPDRLVAVLTTDPKNPGFLPLSTLNYEDFRDQNQVFEGLAAYGFGPLDLTVGGETERIFCNMVTGNYFDVLGVRFSRGRGFLPEEDKALGGHPLVVLSHGLWQRRFGGDTKILGKSVTLNRAPYTVVGIAPEGFTGLVPGFVPDVFVPSMMRNHVNPAFAWLTASRRGLWLNGVGRLKPGVSQDQAQAAMATLARQLEQQYPVANEGRSLALITLAEARANPTGAAQNPIPLIAGLLLAVVTVVLLIACANVANLLLARAASRQREIAIRLTMGAGRVRLVRQLLTESLLLSLLGGAGGLLVAFWAADLLLAFQPVGFFPLNLDASFSLRVLGFTLFVALLTGLIFGLAPALQTTRPDIHESLKEGGRQAAEGISGGRLRSLLVVAEVALAAVALIGAGLFVQSLRNAMSIDPGFRTQNIIAMNLDVSLQGYEPARGEEFYRQLRERLENVPGVDSAALGSRLPLGFGLQRTLILEDQVPSEDERGVLVNVDSVEVGYADTLGIPLVKGREFETYDDADAPRVAIVNQTMAQRFWPDQDAIGRRFRFPAGGDGRVTPLIEVIGIARDAKYVTLGEDPIPFAYLPFRQEYQPGMVLFVETTADPSGIMPLVRRELRAMDPGLPVFNVQTLTQQISNSLWLARMGAYLLSVFGLLALVLAAVGIYGVISYSVSQRTHEIGIRMALGAQQAHILKLVLRRGMLLALVGMAIGLSVAFAATRLIVSLLYGVSAADPVTFAAIPMLLVAVALLACYLPARRATRVDPLLALRYE
jgi:predicted permease